MKLVKGLITVKTKLTIINYDHIIHGSVHSRMYGSYGRKKNLRDRKKIISFFTTLSFLQKSVNPRNAFNSLSKIVRRD